MEVSSRCRIGLLSTALLTTLAVCLDPAVASDPVRASDPVPTAAAGPTSDVDSDDRAVLDGSGLPAPVSASMAIPTGRRETSALLLEKTSPSEAQVGEIFQYDLQVTNLTSGLLHEVVVTDLLAGLEIVRSNPVADQKTVDQITWKLGFLEAGEVREIQVMARADRPGPVLTSSIARYDQVLSMTTEIVQPVLGVRVEGPEEQYLCELLEYRFVVVNSGTGTARDVALTTELPAGLLTVDGQRKVSLVADMILPGGYHEFSITASAVRGGTYNVVATVHGAGDLVIESEPVTTRIIEPILAVSLKGPTKGLADRPHLYQITVRNAGPVPAPDVTVEQLLSEWSKVLKVSAGGELEADRITWSLGSLEPHGRRTLEVMATRSIEGDAVYEVVARGYSARDSRDRVQTHYQGVPDLQLEVVDSDDPVGRGKGTTYTITVTNQGSAAGHDIRLLGSWESKWRYESCSGPTEGSCEDGSITFAPLAILAAKEKATWKVHLKGRGSGDSTFQVIMTTREKARPIEQGEATILYR